jgi:hypothetical protein
MCDTEESLTQRIAVLEEQRNQIDDQIAELGRRRLEVRENKAPAEAQSA